MTGVSCTSGYVRAPLHVVRPVAGHGVTIFATQVADAVGAPVADLDETMRSRPRAVHVHVTDQLFGRDATEAARRLVALGRRHAMTVTLHDVPQPDDGRAFDTRARAYRAVTDAAVGWAVSSRHEQVLLDRHVSPSTPGVVLPLPVVAAPATPTLGSAPGGRPVVGMLGWIYPGKGHAQVIAACARLTTPVTVRAIGSPARHHEDLLEELAATATAAGVGFEHTGFVPDPALPTALAAVDVPVAAHRGVSASASINTWLAAGRRPVVVSGSYAAEMATLRPGTLVLAELGDLAGAIGDALADPLGTHLPPDADLRPHLGDTAAAYLAWWESLR